MKPLAECIAWQEQDAKQFPSADSFAASILHHLRRLAAAEELIREMSGAGSVLVEYLPDNDDIADLDVERWVSARNAVRAFLAAAAPAAPEQRECGTCEVWERGCGCDDQMCEDPDYPHWRPRHWRPRR